jgi:uncharacterized protein
MSYFIDTNVFLRAIIQTDQKVFLECVEFFSLIKTHKIQAWTSSVVLAEVVWTMKSFYGSDKSEIVKALLSINNHKSIRMTENYDYQASIEIFKRFNVKYIDAQIASIKEIQDKEMTVVSYDRDFDRIGVKREEPGEIVKKLNK